MRYVPVIIAGYVTLGVIVITLVLILKANNNPFIAINLVTTPIGWTFIILWPLYTFLILFRGMIVG